MLIYTATEDIGSFQQVDYDENLTGRVMELRPRNEVFEHNHAMLPSVQFVTILARDELYLVPADRLKGKIDPARASPS